MRKTSNTVTVAAGSLPEVVSVLESRGYLLMYTLSDRTASSDLENARPSNGILEMNPPLQSSRSRM